MAEGTHGQGTEPAWTDPSWPRLPDGEHPLTELLSPLQASFSPFGELQFPLDSVHYEHPVTIINS